MRNVLAIVLAIVCLPAGSAQAGVLFDADFETSTSGSPATKANLDAGTTVGDWTVNNRQESIIVTGGSPSDQALDADQGTFDFVANFSSAGLLANGVTVSLDAYIKRAWNDSRRDVISGLDSDGNTVFELQMLPNTQNGAGNPTQHRLAYVDSGGNRQLIGNPNDLVWENTYNPANFKTITLELSATSMDIKLEDAVLAGGDDVGYRSAGVTDIDRLVLLGNDSNSGAFFDDIRVTEVPEPSAFILAALGLVGLGVSGRRTRR